MTNPIDDPMQNFTVPPMEPAGMRIPEFVIRQTISWALSQIRNTLGTPADVVEKLYAQVPRGVRDEFRAWMIANKNLFLDVSWPKDEGHLAMIVVEPQSENEDTENTLLNDAAGTIDRGTLGDVAPTSAPMYAIPERRTTNIYVASNDDRLTLLLYEMVKFILVSNKQSLTAYYDIHNLSVGGGVLEHDSDKLPNYDYYRVMVLQYGTWFDWAGAESAAVVVSISLAIQTAQGVVTVPGPGD